MTTPTAAPPSLDAELRIDEQRSTSGARAIAALVLSVLWIGGIGSIAGLVLGNRSRREIVELDGSPTSRRLATAAIAIGWIGVGALALLAIAIVAPALERIDSVSPFAYLVAFGGGVVSFLSPCVLPIVPAYLSMITGLDVATIQDGERKHMLSITGTTAMFVLGFGSVFVLLGLTATGVGQLLFRNQEVLTRISGALMLSMALFLAGSLFLKAPWLYQEKRFQPNLGRWGRAAPTVMGVAFGFGWTPCIGPVLGSILGIAAATGRVWAGATLLATYSIGLGVPFLISGLALGRLQGTFGWVKTHMSAIVALSAVMLGMFGVLLLMNSFTTLTAELQGFLDRIGLDWIVELG